MIRIVNHVINKHNEEETDIVLEAFLQDKPILIYVDALNDNNVFLVESLNGVELVDVEISDNMIERYIVNEVAL